MGQAETLANVTAIYGPMKIKGRFMCLFIIVMMFMLSWKLALLSIGFLLAIGIVSFCFYMRVSKNDSELS